MRPVSFREPFQRVGGMTRALPARPRSLFISENRKLTFTKANVWSANRRCPLANPGFPPHPVTTRSYRRTSTTSQPYSGITSMITATWLDQISTREKTPVLKGRISMAPGCRMQCSSEVATQCTKGTFRRLPRRMVAFVCRRAWQGRFSKTRRWERL